MTAVEKLWEKYPDWRLGQLIVNVARSAGYEDPFFIEDDRLMEEIRRWEGDETQGNDPSDPSQPESIVARKG